jgi:hypothetical protein
MCLVDVGILGDEKSGEVKSEFLSRENMRRDLGQV